MLHSWWWETKVKEGTSRQAVPLRLFYSPQSFQRGGTEKTTGLGHFYLFRLSFLNWRGSLEARLGEETDPALSLPGDSSWVETNKYWPTEREVPEMWHFMLWPHIYPGGSAALEREGKAFLSPTGPEVSLHAHTGAFILWNRWRVKRCEHICSR